MDVLRLDEWITANEPRDALRAGEVGYIIAGIKELKAAKVGDTVLVRGNVVTDKDYGYGYKYPVIIEDAEVTVEIATQRRINHKGGSPGLREPCILGMKGMEQ